MTIRVTYSVMFDNLMCKVLHLCLVHNIDIYIIPHARPALFTPALCRSVDCGLWALASGLCTARLPRPTRK